MKEITEIDKASIIALRDYMGLSENESLLIVTDETKREISRALLKAGQGLCKEAILIEMKSREINGQEPPSQLAEMMKLFDVVLCPTDKSLTHTNARREAAKSGVRVGTMPGITEGIMSRCLSAEASQILKMSDFIAKKLEGVTEIKVKTHKGTDISMPIKGRQILKSTGILRNKGESGNLPSGEVYLAPIELGSNGKIVIDGSVGVIGMVKEPIIITVKDGYAIDIKGGKEADSLARMLDKAGKDARAVAEFGIGTNYKAELSGNILEDEKVYGTIHIAFGNNVSMGGTITVGSHVDGLITEPDVYFDDELIMSKGKLINY